MSSKNKKSTMENSIDIKSQSSSSTPSAPKKSWNKPNLSPPIRKTLDSDDAFPDLKNRNASSDLSSKSLRSSSDYNSGKQIALNPIPTTPIPTTTPLPAKQGARKPISRLTPIVPAIPQTNSKSCEETRNKLTSGETKIVAVRETTESKTSGINQSNASGINQSNASGINQSKATQESKTRVEKVTRDEKFSVNWKGKNIDVVVVSENPMKASTTRVEKKIDNLEDENNNVGDNEDKDINVGNEEKKNVSNNNKEKKNLMVNNKDTGINGDVKDTGINGDVKDAKINGDVKDTRINRDAKDTRINKGGKEIKTNVSIRDAKNNASNIIGMGERNINDVKDTGEIKNGDNKDNKNLTDKYPPIPSFDDMGLPENLLRGIYGYGFEKPSAIQQRGIHPIIDGKDGIFSAQSGSGKSGCFCIGSLCKIDSKLKSPQVLILSPTKELAQQTEKVYKKISTYMDIVVHACVGGTSTKLDLEILNKGVHVVSATPGRCFDMLNRCAFKPDTLKLLVIDEADEMLSKGFEKQIYDIFKYLPPNTQVCLFSATLGKMYLQSRINSCAILSRY